MSVWRLWEREGGGKGSAFLKKIFLDVINICPLRVNLNNLGFSVNTSEIYHTNDRFK